MDNKKIYNKSNINRTKYIYKNVRYLNNFNLVRYGKKEVDKNPIKDQIIKIGKYTNWKPQLPVIISKKKMFDKTGAQINPYHYETFEQYLMLKYIKSIQYI